MYYLYLEPVAFDLIGKCLVSKQNTQDLTASAAVRIYGHVRHISSAVTRDHVILTQPKYRVLKSAVSS